MSKHLSKQMTGRWQAGLLAVAFASTTTGAWSCPMKKVAGSCRPVANRAKAPCCVTAKGGCKTPGAAPANPDSNPDHPCTPGKDCCPKGCKDCPPSCCGRTLAVPTSTVFFVDSFSVSTTAIYEDIAPRAASIEGIFHPPKT